jgi:hypothetical protein
MSEIRLQPANAQKILSDVLLSQESLHSPSLLKKSVLPALGLIENELRHDSAPNIHDGMKPGINLYRATIAGFFDGNFEGNENFLADKTFILGLMRKSLLVDGDKRLEKYRFSLTDDKNYPSITKMALETDIRELGKIIANASTDVQTKTASATKLQEYKKMLDQLINPPTIPLEPTGN